MDPEPEKRPRLGIIEAALVAAMTILVAWLSGLRHLSQAFSGDTIYRQQTNALLAGHTWLFQTPHLLRYDEAWGNGVQQIWGLGVPLLRLPFEAAARAVGGFGFPDAIVFLIYFAALALALARVAGPADSHAASGQAVRAAWERGAALVLLALCPAFVNLCRTRFEVYEEAIAAAHLWSLLLFALLLSLAERPRARTLALLGAAAGVAPLFRPTAIFYGGVAVAIGLWLAWRARLGRRALAGGAALFALGVAAELVLNQIRYLGLFEFGQRINLSYNPIDQLNKNFDAPYWHEPLGRASGELFSSLFLRQQANGYDFYRAGILPLQSPTLRFREFYFLTYEWWMAPLLLAAWGAVLLAFLMRRRSETARALLADRRLMVGALFSFAGFVCMAGFYLRMPAMTSRYAVDFAPAIAAGLATLWWLDFRLVRLWLDGKSATAASLVLALAALTATALPIYHCWFGDTQSQRRLLDAASVAALLPSAAEAPPPIPNRYHCGDSPKVSCDLNGTGWDARRTCHVAVSTPFLLPTSECINLQLGPPIGQLQLGIEQTRPVRARRGITPLILVRDVPLDNGRLLTFCAPSNASRNPTGIELYSIAWIDPLTVKPQNRSVMRLIEISTADQ